MQKVRFTVFLNFVCGILVLCIGLFITFASYMNANTFKTFEESKPFIHRLRTFQYWSLAVLGINLLTNVFKTIFLSKEHETFVKLSLLLDHLKQKSVIDEDVFKNLHSLKSSNIFEIDKYF